MCKSDRELLELTAKAAGLQLCGYSWVGENEDDEEFEILESAFVKRRKEQGLATKWNPLTDDGDALRLAVKLGIFVGRGAARLEGLQYPGSEWITEGWLDDPMPATRRAIVRAAAAIGEAMQ